LLFREAGESLGGLELGGGFDGSGGGEGPARSALSLVLDGGNVTLFKPVDGRGGRSRVNVDVAGEDVVGSVEESEVLSLEFFVGGDHELVDSEGVGGVSRVALDGVQVLGEHGHSVLFFLGGGHLDVVFTAPFLELLFNGGSHGEGGGGLVFSSEQHDCCSE
jgi:hypothetical protein